MKQKRFESVALCLICLLIAAPVATAVETHTGLLGEGTPWQTPWYINDSGIDGPTVVITGGIHGNEPAGAASAEQIRHWPIVRGKLVVIPRVNTAGLEANTRYIPGAVDAQKDLNRNFPSPGIAQQPRGEIATELWEFVVNQDPDWLFDLHEGYEFNISHKPKPGKKKSVGSTIIYSSRQEIGPMVERMLTAANGTVSDPDRKFVLRGRGPIKRSLASAVNLILNKRAMILETTYKSQPLSIRTHQHRVMIASALRQLEIIERTAEELDELLVSANAEMSQEGVAAQPLSKQQAERLVEVLWEDYAVGETNKRQREIESGQITIGDKTMPFWYKVFGDKPRSGRRLYISMHGGGSAPAAVNDRQYENQKRLYEPDEGVYFVPRAPTNTWNLWHESHIDAFFQRVIENMVLLEDVDPNRVYIMGYSAGGDGVFQLAPRMADRLAAAAMMAGHPNETTPDGLRNLSFTIHMGEHDSAYDRNRLASQWKTTLDDLHRQDPGGYRNQVTIHEGMGHWVNRKDAVAVPWMAQFSRVTCPDLIVWKQDDRTHQRFYWLAVDQQHARPNAIVRVKHDGQAFEIQQCDAAKLLIRVNDQMIDFGQNVRVTYQGDVLFDGQLNRSKAVIEKTFNERHDVNAVYSAEIAVEIPL
ncbi:dienelactone hydrolase family protein [Roseiconus lacunae]|uniref:dienelactone hydrolase family protein n=1 Tax=Roseiconus lacunae TaxID=2605694 RepID=UPI001E53BC19|nr:succinylglutamate desuccinylase/aspartoacylase family protein [Roseiconus lacunae]MCD0462425.1 succinylglutamate desuccinylase/aspartoacylase family protein [Roseiconus lacunae]